MDLPDLTPSRPREASGSSSRRPQFPNRLLISDRRRSCSPSGPAVSGRAGRIRLVAPRTIPNRRLGQLEETWQSVSFRVRTDVSWSRFLDIKSEAMTASDRRPSNACTEVRRVSTGRGTGPAAGEADRQDREAPTDRRVVPAALGWTGPTSTSRSARSALITFNPGLRAALLSALARFGASCGPPAGLGKRPDLTIDVLSSSASTRRVAMRCSWSRPSQGPETSAVFQGGAVSGVISSTSFLVSASRRSGGGLESVTR